jgi:hypothetical protein
VILRAVKRAFEQASAKGWDKTYWAVDIHDTFIRANYKHGSIPTEFVPYAAECLRLLTERTDVCLILYTCSHPEEIAQYNEHFANHCIKFDHVNSNPEVVTQGYGCYDSKFYFNVLIDDKAGFDCDEDWKTLLIYLQGFA